MGAARCMHFLSQQGNALEVMLGEIYVTAPLFRVGKSWNPPLDASNGYVLCLLHPLKATRVLSGRQGSSHDRGGLRSRRPATLPLAKVGCFRLASLPAALRPVQAPQPRLLSARDCSLDAATLSLNMT